MPNMNDLEKGSVTSATHLISSTWEGMGASSAEGQIMEMVREGEMEQTQAKAETKSNVMTKYWLTFKSKDLESDFQNWRFMKTRLLYMVVFAVFFLVVLINEYNFWIDPNQWIGVESVQEYVGTKIISILSVSITLIAFIVLKFVPRIYQPVQHYVNSAILMFYYFRFPFFMAILVLDQVVVGILSVPFFKTPPLFAVLLNATFFIYTCAYLAVGQAGLSQILHRILYSGAVSLLVITACYQLEKTYRLDYFQKIKNDYSFASLDAVLRGLLPDNAVNRLYAGEGNEARRVDDATVVFATLDIEVDEKKHGLLDKARIYHNLLEKFDKVIEEGGLYKVSSTIAGSFLAAAGIPEEVDDQSGRSLIVALGLLEAAKRTDIEGVDLRVRIGIHRGPVAAGVIGKSRPYYQIMGDTVNTSARLATTASPNHIQVAHSFFEKIPQDHEIRNRVQILDRGNVWMKGKGEITTSIIVPLSNDRIEIPPPVLEPTEIFQIKPIDESKKFVLEGKNQSKSREEEPSIPNKITDVHEWDSDLSVMHRKGSAISIGSSTLVAQMAPSFDTEIAGNKGQNIELSSIASDSMVSESEVSFVDLDKKRSLFAKLLKEKSTSKRRHQLVKDENKVHKGLGTFQQNAAEIYSTSIWSLKYKNNPHMEKIFNRMSETYNRSGFYNVIKFILVFQILLAITDFVWVFQWGSDVAIGQSKKMTLQMINSTTDQPAPGVLPFSWMGVLLSIRIVTILITLAVWFSCRYLKPYLKRGQIGRALIMSMLLLAQSVNLFTPDHQYVADMELFLNFGLLVHIFSLSYAISAPLAIANAFAAFVSIYLKAVFDGLLEDNPGELYWHLQPIVIATVSAIIGIRIREKLWRSAMAARLKQRRLQRQAQTLLHDLIPKDVQGKWRETVLNSMKKNNAMRRKGDLEKQEKLFNSFLPSAPKSLGVKDFIADLYPNVAIMVADIVSFTASSEKLSPEVLCSFLTSIYSRFDRAAVMNDVYKVDIVGDAYVVMCGAPNQVPDAADRILSFGFDILKITEDLKWPHTERPVQIRIGAAFGPLVTGIFGSRRPRYQPFGRVVGEAEALEQTGRPGAVHISKKLSEELYESYLVVNDEGNLYALSSQKKTLNVYSSMNFEEEEEELFDAEALQRQIQENSLPETKKNPASEVAIRAIRRY